MFKSSLDLGTGYILVSVQERKEMYTRKYNVTKRCVQDENLFLE